jgi:uncharacterized membrane protein YbhN (UPF0104 family)
MSSKLGWAARVLVAVAVLILVLHQLDLREIGQVVVSPRWLPLLGMIAASVVFMLLGGVNIWVMLSALVPVRLETVLRHYLVAAALGSFTPAALGDFSLAGLLRRENISPHHVLSAMFIDRVITLSLYAVVYLPVTLVLVLSAPQWLWLPVAFATAAVFAVSLNRSPSFRRWVVERLIRRLVPSVEGVLRTCSDLLRFHPGTLLVDLAVTVVRSLVGGLAIYLALRAAGTAVGFAYTVVVTNSLSLLGYLPISVSGIGIYEGGAVAAFSRLGANSERVFAALVFQRIYVIASSVALLGAERLLRPRTLSDPTREVEVRS